MFKSSRNEGHHEPTEIGAFAFNSSVRGLAVFGAVPNARGVEEIRFVLEIDVHVPEESIQTRPFLETCPVRHHIHSIDQVARNRVSSRQFVCLVGRRWRGERGFRHAARGSHTWQRPS